MSLRIRLSGISEVSALPAILHFRWTLSWLSRCSKAYYHGQTSAQMAKTDRTVLRTDDWPTSIESKATAYRPTSCYHDLTIRISHRGPLRLLRSRPAQRLAYLILALAALQLYLLHSEYHGALVAKYSPTVFTRLSLRDEDLLGSTKWHVDTDDQNQRRERLLKSREQWKRLGSGCEGDTFSFNGSVIKVYKPRRSPLRNCVPKTESGLRWPSEVPVSLLLGGLSDQHDVAISDRTDFLPVYDYFLLPSGDNSPEQWHLVTPFLKTGTLEQLARRLRTQNSSQTVEDVDIRYRPSFNRLLKALSKMHSHELCHDDIKMDNIFVTDIGQPSDNKNSLSSRKEAHWLIADLGNARQPNHSYHSSLLWAHDNGQNTDCRVNDVVRLLKSYLLFLQSAVTAGDSSDAFNKAFLEASAPWSRLYWYTINSARGHLHGARAARKILAMSTGPFAPSESFERPELPQISAQTMSIASEDEDLESLSQPRIQRTSWNGWTWPGSRGSIQEASLVSQQLRMGMRASEKWAKIYGTFGILPIPNEQC